MSARVPLLRPLRRLGRALTSRGCAGIGRRFAITESVCFLAKLVRGWRVEALVRAGESRAQWAERVMQGKALMTFGVRDVPVRLVRRG